jgi:hypothetical protein
MEASSIRYGEETVKHQKPRRGMGRNPDNNPDFAADFLLEQNFAALRKGKGVSCSERNSANRKD